MRRLAFLTLAAGLVGALPLAPTAGATPSVVSLAITGRVSVTSTGQGQLGAYAMGSRVLVDGSGRFVAFDTTSWLQPDDKNAKADVYLRDRLSNTTTRVSLNDAGAEIQGASSLCGLSDDARYVGFTSAAVNLQGGTTTQVYLRDRKAGHTSIISINTASQKAGSKAVDSAEDACPVSADGRFVAFRSTATNLVATDTNNQPDVFRRDRLGQITQRVSLDTNGNEVVGSVGTVSMSDDGQTVAWDSNATTLVPNDTNQKTDVFVRSMAAQTTVRANLSDADLQTTGADSVEPQISGDGKTVVFRTSAPGLTPDDTRGQADVFARDLAAKTTELISVSTSGEQANTPSYIPGISDDGRFVTFSTMASNLYVADSNGLLDLYRRDREADRTDLISRTNAVVAGNHSSSTRATISDDGSVAAFLSHASNLVRNENDGPDAFVRDFTVRPWPFGSIDEFTKQQFADFAGRQPTPTELQTWHDRVANGEWSFDSMVVSLARSTAFSSKRAPLIRLYYAYFRRVPDSSGMDYWTKKLTNGMTLAKVAASFATSSEFKTATGGLTNTEFVEFVYDQVLDRSPDAAGLSFWVKRLDAKTKSRGDLMTNFSESSEGIRHLSPATDTVLVNLGMRRKMPNANELGNGLYALTTDHEPAELLALSIRQYADDYAARF